MNFVLCLFSSVASAAVSTTCLKTTSTYFGVEGGTAYSDYNYLVYNESPDWYYRLTTILLCSDSKGNLNGIQGQVGQYSQSDGGLLERISTNIGGNTSGLC